MATAARRDGGAVCVVGAIALAMLAPSRVGAWEARLVGSGPGAGDALTITSASNGDVIAGGYLDEPGSGPDFAVARLASADGSELWRVVLPGPGTGGTTLLPNDRATAVALDDAGDVLAAGATSSLTRTAQFSVVKLAGGTSATIWRYDLPNMDGAALALALDAAGDAIVAGVAQDAMGESLYTITKLAHDSGAPLWTVQGVGGPARAVAALAGGDVVVAGELPENTVVRLSGATGTERWHATLGPLYTPPDADKLVVVTDGILVAGPVQSLGVAGADFLRANDGTVLWSNLWGLSSTATSIVAAIPRGTTGEIALLRNDLGFCGLENLAYAATAFHADVVSGADGATLADYTVASYCSNGGEALAASAGGDLFLVGVTSGYEQSDAQIFQPASTLVTARVSGPSLEKAWRVEHPIVTGTVVPPEVPGNFVANVARPTADTRMILAGHVLPPPSATTTPVFTVLTIDTADGALRACGDGVRDPGEQCDDGNLAAGDCCSADCRTAAADGVSCDDGNACTTGDMCHGGACAGTSSCSPCGVCDTRAGCLGFPSPCGRPTKANAAALLLARGQGARSRLAWSLRSGPATSPSDLGDPLHTTGYALCMYDAPGHTLTAGIAAAGTCPGRRHCWKRTKRGYVYDDPRASGGLSRLSLRAGADGRSRFEAIGKGRHLFLPAMPIASDDVFVQLKRIDQDGVCWAAEYTAKKNGARLFRARGE